MRNKATKNRNQAPRNTAIKLALNPKVQVVAPAMHKAFRQADLHTNICRVASGYYDIGSRTLLIGKCSRELSDSDYIVLYIAIKGVRNEYRISALPKDTGMIDVNSHLQLSGLSECCINLILYAPDLLIS